MHHWLAGVDAPGYNQNLRLVTAECSN